MKTKSLLLATALLMSTSTSATPSFNVPGLPVVRKTVSSVGSRITKQL